MTLKNLTATVGLIASSALAVTLTTSSSFAADHAEAPDATAQPSADIADYYAWHADDRLNMILTFSSLGAPGAPADFDASRLYTFHFDTSVPADGISEMEIYARFAQNAAGQWGVQVTGADTDVIEGGVETILNQGDTSVWAGLADDPFFFDQTGFRATVASGDLSFDNTNNDFAGTNVTAIVVQLPLTTIMGAGTALQTWTTTSTL